MIPRIAIRGLLMIDVVVGTVLLDALRVGGSDQPGEKMSRVDDDPNRPVVLTKVENETLAALIVAGLEERGVEAETTGALTSGFRAQAPGGVQVIVRAVDKDRAEEALNDMTSGGQEGY